MNDSANLRLLSRLAIAVLTLAALYLIPYKKLSDYHIIALTMLIAIPIAAYRLEYRLFARRAVITMGCPQDGLGKKLFWNAAIVKLINYVFALFIAIILISIVSSFERLNINPPPDASNIASSLITSQWTLVLASSLLLVMLEAITLKTARQHTRGQMAAIAQRGVIKWPVAIFIIFVAYLNYFYTGHEYLVGKDLATLVDERFREDIQMYASPILGIMHALNSALDTATMYFAQNYIPRIDDTAAKWIIWSYLALKSAISVGIVIYLMLGILTLASVRERGGWKLLGDTVFERYFTVTLIIFIVAYIYASRINYIPNELAIPTPQIDCEELLGDFDSKKTTRVRELSVEEKNLSEEVERKINENVDKIFAASEPGIEKFLDWHFSVLGEYQQLGTQISAKIAQGTTARLQSYVMNPINDELQSFGKKIDSDILEQLNKSSSTKDLQASIPSEFSKCFPSFSLNSITFKEIPVYVGQPQSIIAGGAIAAIVAKKTTAKLAAKTAGKVAGKYAASLATGLTAATLCGPFAPVCGVGAATVTWFAMDVAIVSADEFLNRDELRQDIQNGLNEQTLKVKEEMLSLHLMRIAQSYDLMKKQFRVPTDGFDPET